MGGVNKIQVLKGEKAESDDSAFLFESREAYEQLGGKTGTM